MLYLILVLCSAQNIKAVSVDIDGSIDLGPQWKYEYKIQPLANAKDSNETIMRANRQNLVADMAIAAGSKIYDIIQNIQFEDVKSNEYKAFETPATERSTTTETKSKKIHSKDKYRNERLGIDTEKQFLRDRTKRVHKRKPVTTRRTTTKKTKKFKESIESFEFVKQETSKATIKLTTKKPVTPIVSRIDDVDMFVKPVRVKDDAALTDHIHHIYKQSLKVFDDLKNKIDSYKLKKEVKFLSRSYDEKFKEFVKENKYHVVKSRLGKKKVILNAAETSNKILDRLIGYLKSKVETNGLRSNVPNVFENELKKKINLENKRMCKKFGICRSGKGFRNFLIEVFTIILNSDDRKVKEATDALTEVFKNRDFGKIMDGPTELHFQKGIREFETYDVDTLRPIYFIMRNILVNINEPLKVSNKDRHINKTVAFIEFIDIFEEQMPPNEENKLSWDDMLNALRAWSRNERFDMTDIIESFIDHIMKAIDGFDVQTNMQIEKSLNIMICQ